MYNPRTVITIDNDEAAVVGPVRRKSRTKEELALPVVYRTVSAEVQNELDRTIVLECRPVDEQGQITSAPTSDEDTTSYELINQLSIHRQQAQEFRRRYTGLSIEEKPTSGIQASPVAPKISTVSSRTHRTSEAAVVNAIDAIKEAQIDDHLIPLEVLEKRLETSMLDGLTEKEVLRRRAKDGRNELSPIKTLPAWLAFLKCLVGGFGFVLWIACVLCILAYKPLGGEKADTYNLILAAVIFAVNLAQAVFFFVQERRSTNLMATFANMLPTTCTVIRDGNVITVEGVELVVGDVVRIKGGDKVPADMRVFEVHQAKVEKSSLTGESEPIPLSATSADPNLYETRNIALFGTSVLEGTATGMVINIADRTVMGRIARMASSTSAVATSLQRELNYFTGMVAVMSVTVCVIVLVGYYAGVERKHPGYLPLPAVITNCIAVVVSLLPEGTPVALAMILSMIAKRMYMEKILVKKLTVLETLGSATLIASDKTGTLTQNRMTLNHLCTINDQSAGSVDRVDVKRKDTVSEQKQYDELEQSITGVFASKNISRNLSKPALNYLCQIMGLCNKTVFQADEEGKRGRKKCIGNPTEAALLIAADEFLDVDDLHHAAPIVSEIAFSSRTKYHLTVHKIQDQYPFQNTAHAIHSDDGGAPCTFIVFVKGAPELVLSMCTRAVVNDKEVNLNPSLTSHVMRVNDLMADRGERVLAFGYKKLFASEYPENYIFDMDDENRWTDGLCFLGLAGIIDPPREGVSAAIDECHGAHIRVMMVTGDQPGTAVAIARAVNIITHNIVKSMTDVLRVIPFTVDEIGEKTMQNRFLERLKAFFKAAPKRRFFDESIVVAGHDISQLSDKQWDFVLQHREVVFARTTPQQKLQIVKESRKRGDVVAVTGDGVNDAPALKAADLGIAMGICGSDVSKEAANMVLLDDNFVTIVKGIKEGRLLFDNLKKVVCYLFPNGSFSEILPVLAAVFLGMPIPLSTFLMIIICVGPDMVGSLSLIHEYPESDIMRRPPRDARKDRLIDPRTILFAYFFVGIMESSIAFFMYFFAMWECGVHPNQLLFAYDKWGMDGWIQKEGLNGTMVNLTLTQQDDLNHVGQTAFFISLVMTQLWNLLAVRTRFQSIFTHKFQFKFIYYMLGEVAIVLAMVYLPAVQFYTYTKPMEYHHFLMPLAMGSIILVCDETRKFFVRKYPKGIIAKVAW